MPQEASPIRAELSASVHGHEITASILFTNISTETQLLNKRNACVEGHTGENVFVIRCGEMYAKYIGIFSKRSPPKESDYVELAPGQDFHVEVRIDGFYASAQDDIVRTYHIYYESVHGSALEGVFVVTSNTAEFLAPS